MNDKNSIEPPEQFSKRKMNMNMNIKIHIQTQTKIDSKLNNK